MCRCQLWLKNCGRDDLLHLSSRYLHENRRLCSKHFHRGMFANSQCKRLVKDAVPTIFKSTSLCFVTLQSVSSSLILMHIFTVRRYALHGLSYRNSVRLSVCPSVCPSVTLVDCVHMVRPTIIISSPYGSPIILVSGDITLIPKFEGGHPAPGC